MGRLRSFVKIGDADPLLLLRAIRRGVGGRWSEVETVGPIHSTDRGPVRVAAGYESYEDREPAAAMIVWPEGGTSRVDLAYEIWFSAHTPLVVMLSAVRSAVEEVDPL